MDPSRGWDNQLSKINPSSLHFKQKITKGFPWINDLYNPHKTKVMLQKNVKAPNGQAQDYGLLECGKDGFTSAVQAQELQEKSGWEILSLEEALTSIERMPQPPSVQNLTCILQKCSTKKNPADTKRLYAYICKRGLQDRRSFGKYLVPMLAQAGSMCDAEQVFNKMVDRNENIWTSLIMGFIECGQPQHALNLYQKMQESSVLPSKYTFLALLKACARLKSAERGRDIHAEIARNGLERDLFVGSTLVDMYAKCGFLAKARRAFDKLPVRDAVSWNALIAGYAEKGLGEEALSCFKQMQLEGLSPTAITFVCTLKSCGCIGAIDKGQEIHAEIVRKGLERNIFVGSTLVDMYGKCGLLPKACEAFDQLPVRNEVSWNALMTVYTEHGLGEEALDCFEQMQLEGFFANAATFASSLKACGSMGAIDEGQEIHAEISRKGLETDLIVGSTLLDMYAKCGSLAKAQEAFDKLLVRDLVSWNALIAGYAEQGPSEGALDCFEQMQREGLSADVFTFVSSLKACGSIGAIEKSQEIHAEIVRKGLETDLFTGSSLVDMYAKCGSLAQAQEAFDKLPIQDVVSWTALITGYAEHGFCEEALTCFENMRLEGFPPDAVTFGCSLKVCGSIGAMDEGREIHSEIARKGLERDLGVGNILVDMYAKCGLLAKAREVFDRLLCQDVASWNALLAGYAQLGESGHVLHMIERMDGEGIKPDGVTFSIVLVVCSHAGLLDKGQMYFEAMSKDYGIIPTIEHYTLMVDLLGRAGQLNEALAMVEKMPFDPDLAVWHTLLGSCRKWGNVELGRVAFEHAVLLDEKDAAAYVLMCNIYADAQMQEEEKQFKGMQVKELAWAKPGQSWWMGIGRIVDTRHF